ncbi:MAG: MFS transporter [Dehalococcoidia bacterium]
MASARLRRALSPLLGHERLLMITVSTMLVMMGQGVIAPVLPLFRDQFDATSAQIGLTLTSFGLARVLLNVPMGIVADRYGRRVLLLSGPAIAAVGMLGSGFSGSLGELIAWRFVAGAGSAIYATGAQIYLADISTPDTRARYLGTNQGALLLGVSLGPAIGGFAAAALGLAAPFVIVGAASAVAAVYAWWRIEETRDGARDAEARERAAHGSPAGGRSAWLRILLSPPFMLVALANLAVFFTRTGGRQTMVPLLGDEIGISTAGLGGIFTTMALINMVLVIPASFIADRYGRKWAIVPSGIAVGGSMFLFAWSDSYAMFVVAAVVHALATSLSASAPIAYAVDIAPPGMRGLTMGMFRSVGDIGFMLGPPALGLIADYSTFGWAMVANGVFMAVASALFLLAREPKRGGGRVTPPAPASTRAP